MLYREVIVFCSEIQTKLIITECEQYVELLNVEMVVHIVTTWFKMLNLTYKNKSVKTVYGNKRCLFSNPHTTHNWTVWAERRMFKVKLVVHIVTTGL
jgi:hypothetical protein